MKEEKLPARFRFGVHELDVEQGELRRSGVPVRLQAQPLRLLGLLVTHADQIVSREEIRRHVWPSDVHVEFDQAINACIKQIRRALGDSAEVPRVIQTVPRGGYRFLLPVTPVESGEPRSGPATSRSGAGGSTSSLHTPAARRRLLWAFGAAACLLVLGAALGYRLAERKRPEPVLAVLPFAPLTDQKDDSLFCEALTDELITQLGRRYGARLAVIARTSVMKYRGSHDGARAIGRALGADFVLEGSVRRVDRHVRVQAQLVRVDDELHVWANAFQRDSDDLLALQIELGEKIAEGLALKLVPAAESMAGATRPDVYESYLRGRQLANQARLPEARLTLERTVGSDPGFAPAWAALGQVYSALPPEARARSLARDAVARAIALDDGLPEAHLQLARMRFYQDYDFEGARQAWEQAIALNPGYAQAHEDFAAYYSVHGKHDEAIAEVQRARRLDPLSSMTNSDVGWYYYFAHRFPEAIENSKRTLALDPDFFWAHLCLQLSYLQRTDWQGAIEDARRQMTRAGAPAALLAPLSSPDRKIALGAYWRWLLAGTEQRQRKIFVAPCTFAQIHMALGETPRALDELETSFETRTGWILPFLAVDPLFDPLRADPRFRDLLARIASG